MKFFKNRTAGIKVISAVLLLSIIIGLKAQKPVTAEHEGEICDVRSFSMNRICKEWDGQWEGITVASDGNCYFSTSTHSRGHGAGFHMYNPNTKEHLSLIHI